MLIPVFLACLLAQPPAQPHDPPHDPPAAAPEARPAERRMLTPDQWASDLEQLAKDLPAKHKNFFHRTGKEPWERRVADLKAKLPDLSEPVTILELAKLCAAADAHTQLLALPYFRSRPAFPVAFTAVKEGLVLTAAPADNADLLGSLLVGIGGVPAAAAVERLSEFYPWENAPSRTLFLAPWLTRPDAYLAAGLTTTPEHADFTLRTPAGEERTVALRSAPSADLRAGKVKVAPLTIAPAGLAALSAKQDPRALWFAMLPDKPVLYLRYNHCSDDKDGKVADYADAALARLEQGVERLIIDLRFNGGGNSALLDPFIAALAAREPFKKKGSVLVLTAAGTFSSAQLNASSLRKRCGAVVLGEPTGQKPNTYGEVKSFALTNSKLQVAYSTKLFKTEAGDPDSMTPDVLIEPTRADLLAGKDPILEAAAVYEPR